LRQLTPCGKAVKGFRGLGLSHFNPAAKECGRRPGCDTRRREYEAQCNGRDGSGNEPMDAASVARADVPNSLSTGAG